MIKWVLMADAPSAEEAAGSEAGVAHPGLCTRRRRQQQSMGSGDGVGSPHALDTKTAPAFAVFVGAFAAGMGTGSGIPVSLLHGFALLPWK